MKIFLYKFIVILLGIFLLFELTVGSQIKKLERKFYSLTSKEKIFIYKNKIKEEIRKANTKETILSGEDADLLKKFINKINSELNN